MMCRIHRRPDCACDSRAFASGNPPSNVHAQAYVNSGYQVFDNHHARERYDADRKQEEIVRTKIANGELIEGWEEYYFSKRMPEDMMANLTLTQPSGAMSNGRPYLTQPQGHQPVLGHASPPSHQEYLGHDVIISPSSSSGSHQHLHSSSASNMAYQQYPLSYAYPARSLSPQSPQVTPVRHFPTFVCQFSSCGMSVNVNLDALKKHMSAEHGIIQKKTEYVCYWVGCQCSPQAYRIGRCPGPTETGATTTTTTANTTSTAHPAHVKNLPEHIWERHLGFRFVCVACDKADWKDASSLQRHQDGQCRGRSAVRCGMCFNVFSSELELVTHARTSCPEFASSSSSASA